VEAKRYSAGPLGRSGRYALAMTARPWTVRRADIEALRAIGLSDRDVVDANQVAAEYNYVNRVADGLSVELEDDWPPRHAGHGRTRSREGLTWPNRFRHTPVESPRWISCTGSASTRPRAVTHAAALDFNPRRSSNAAGEVSDDRQAPHARAQATSCAGRSSARS
jgi:hypothetical protein